MTSNEADPLASSEGKRRGTAGELVAELYPELRRIAGSLLGPRAAGVTLQPTAIVNEAYLRLSDQKVAEWGGRAHFLSIAARCMRRVLVDHVRARGAEKRPATDRRVTLVAELASGSSAVELDLFELDRALERLGAVKERYVQVVELRFFAGASLEETAEALGVTRTVVVREWSKARAWLRTFLEDGTEGAESA